MNQAQSVTSFSMINAAGDEVLYDDFSGNSDCKYRGPTVKYLWKMGVISCERPTPNNDGMWVLPDASGFLVCENAKRSDNLLLLDAFGKERMRLGVPWQMTGCTDPRSGEYPSRFIGLTTTWTHPITDELGKLGLHVYVAGSGLWETWYFEFDWQAGKFLWCRPMRP